MTSNGCIGSAAGRAMGRVLALAIALGWAGAALGQAAPKSCEIMLKACRASCEATCSGQDKASCRQACGGEAGCLADFDYCLEQAGVDPDSVAAPAQDAPQEGVSPAEKTATRSLAPAQAAPEAAAAAPAGRVMSLDEPMPGGDLAPRIFFLRRTDAEPDALFYGYLVIGPNVSQERKLAVIQGVACRLDVVDAESAASIDRLGLVSIPALVAAEGEVTTPLEVLNAYDFPRAERWLRAAGFAAEAAFDIDRAVLFIGSRRPRAAQLDAVALPGPDESRDPVIADASALTPRYLERWTYEIVEGVRTGSLRSRQDLQTIMEAHSWLEVIGTPLAAVLRIAPAQAAPPPTSCL